MASICSRTRTVDSMKDWPPDGIFLDWPKMSMEQVFRNVQILGSQGMQLRSNGPDNEASTRTENVSWKPDFREDRMDYENIGLTAEFPAEFGGRPGTRWQACNRSSAGRRRPAYLHWLHNGS